MKEKNIKDVYLDDLAAMEDRIRVEAPDGPTFGPEFWKSAKIVYPKVPKDRLTVRFDRDMVEWFKARGKGYQTRMNAVLRSFYEARRDMK